MSRDWQHYLSDILASCRKVLRYTDGFDLASFVADDKTYDAVIRNLEIVGEAVKQLPEAYLQTMPEIEWRKIAGFRDIVAHAYFGIDDTILWDIVENKVPELLDALERSQSGDDA